MHSFDILPPGMIYLLVPQTTQASAAARRAAKHRYTQTSVISFFVTSNADTFYHSAV